jgi:branched-chain amino acid transport system substrate-binding protein
VGIIGSYSGSQAASTGEVPAVAQAWASTVNASGGIDGHPVKLYIEDDASSPATALTAVHTLVQQDHIVAIVGDASNVDAVWAPYIEQAGVPVVGGLSFDSPYISNPDFFATGANSISAIYGEAKLAKSFGGKYGLLYCAEAAACKQVATLTGSLAKSVGLSVPVSAPVSSTAPDYTAVCIEIKDSGVESYSIADAGGVALRIAQACAQQGVTAKLITGPGTITSSWKGISLLDGTRGVDLVAPWFDSSTPATRAYQVAVQKYVPNMGGGNGTEESEQWVAGQLFEAAVKASGSDTVTAASVKAGLYALHNETLGGLTQPLNYVKDKPNLFNCWFTVGMESSAFVTPMGLKTTCAPDAVVSQIISAS